MNDLQAIGKMIMFLGAVFLLVGVLVYFAARMGLGRIPGDIVYKKGNFTFYFPVVTSLIISLILTVIMLLLRLRK